MNGALSYHAGMAAEDAVALNYQRRSHAIAARRWRGKSGEIDMVARDGETVVFVEVKKSKTFAKAIEKLRRRQIDRIYRSAEEFLANEPRGALTDVRFDVALVDGQGAIEIVENAQFFH